MALIPKHRSGLGFVQVGFILGVLSSCTPSSSSSNTAEIKLVKTDIRNQFAGTWCWQNTVLCGVSNSQAQTSITIDKSGEENEVTVLGLKGEVIGNALMLTPKADAFGGVWSGRIVRDGEKLLINLSIYYPATKVTCANNGTAVMGEGCGG